MMLAWITLSFWTVFVCANSVDPDQTAPLEAVLSGSTLIAFCLHLLDTLLYGKTKQFRFYDNFSKFSDFHNM